jgi:hypothetical protein
MKGHVGVGKRGWSAVCVIARAGAFALQLGS